MWYLVRKINHSVTQQAEEKGCLQANIKWASKGFVG